jgi:hypoxanthine phosphoribosyltransferase
MAREQRKTVLSKLSSWETKLAQISLRSALREGRGEVGGSEMKVRSCPGHTEAVFDMAQLPDVVCWATRVLRKLKPDAIAACGHSGLVLGGILSHKLRIPLMAVRKQGEPVVATYCRREVSAILSKKAATWVWVDDVISTGSTIQHACEMLEQSELVRHRAPAAALLYGYQHGTVDVHGVKRVNVEGDDSIYAERTNVTAYYYRLDWRKQLNKLWRKS